MNLIEDRGSAAKDSRAEEDEAFRLDEILPPENQDLNLEAETDYSEPEPADDDIRFDQIIAPVAQDPKLDDPELITPSVPEDDDLFTLDEFNAPTEPFQDPGPEIDHDPPITESEEFSLDDLFTPDKPADAPDQHKIAQDEPVPVEDLESSSAAWLEEISRLEEQTSPTGQPDDQVPQEKPAEDPDSPFSFLDPGQSTEEFSHQDPKPEEIADTPETWEKAEPAPESPGFEEDSGWLDMLTDPDSREEPQPEIDPNLKDEKPQTDWLTKIKRLNKSADLVEEDSSFPDWLSVSEKPAEEPAEIEELIEEVEAEELEETPSSELPAWLQLDEDDESLNEFLRKKDLTNEEFRPQSVDEKQQDTLSMDGYGVPEIDEDSSQPRKFPSWADGQSNPEKIPEELQFLTGMDQEDAPSTIVDPFQGEDEYIDDLFSDELPEWLTTASTTEEILPFETEITLGDLPGWVEAMRPVVESGGASGLSDDEDYIENYGPLAGIPSVLPAEADILQDPAKEARKPLDLVANKTQQDYVNLLKKLIGEEGKSKPIQKAAPVQTQRILRWLISLILLVSTAGTIIFGGNFVNPDPDQTASYSTGFGSLYAEIESLSAGQPVLIAHDYQPAAAGELHTAAAGVVDHLMEQGTYLTFVSTVPTGPALAEYFLATTQKIHDYRHTQQYINLGYLPGESAGLLSFIIAPEMIIPLAFDGSNAWGSPPLIDVDSIQDFAMILVITDDPNTAKIWLEQVGPILEVTPLTMVVSAHVEPLIQPYFRSSPQQLAGYVSGIIDSVNYEDLIGRPNLASERWLPFNIGIIISVGTIFIGGLSNGVLALFSRQRAKAKGEIK